MSQAEDLLNTLSDIYYEGPHITVNSNRTITIPDALKHIAVTGDHNIETVTFDCPRYWDEHDFSMMKVYINYQRPDGFKDCCPVKNLRISDKVDTQIQFEWTLTGNVTAVKGNLSFLVYIESSDANPCWHSRLNQDLIVDEGLDCKEQIARAPDSIEDVLARTTASYIAEAKAEIEGKAAQVLATIPEDYTEVNNMAEEALRKKANAIELEAEGEAITVDNSADAYLLGLKLFGKTTQVTTTGVQLLDIPDADSKTDRGLTQIISGGICVVKGTASSTAAFNLTLAGSYSGTDILFTLEPGTYTATDCNISSYDGTTRTNHTGTFTLAEAFDVTWVSTRSYGATETVNETTYPMLNAGDTALEWERYSGGAASPNPDYPWDLESIGADNTIGATVHGKNLLKPRAVSGSGYTAVVNDDGSVTVTGAATTTNAIYLTIAAPATDNPLYLREGVPYFMWSNSTNGKDIGTKTVDRYGNSLWGSTSAWNRNFSQDYDRLVQIYIESIRHEIGDTSLCGTYWFQLEVGTEFTGFEAYKDPQTLDAAYTLPGIPVDSDGNYTDANGQQWVCDEIDFERGVYVQNVGTRTFDGSEDENWVDELDLATTTMFRIEIPDSVSVGNVSAADFLCSHFMQKQIYNGDSVGAQHTMRQFYFRLANSTLESLDLAGWRVWLAQNPITVQYVLQTPIETALTDAEIAAFMALRTNLPHTTVLNDAGAHMAIKYNGDTTTCLANNPFIRDRLLLKDVATGVVYALHIIDGAVSVEAVS